MISLKQSVEYSKWLVLIIVGASFLAWQTNVSWKHLLYFLVTIALMICAFVFLESQNRGETIDKPTNDLAESMRSNPYTRRLGSNAQESKKNRSS
jgi:Na+-transporting NADH:ubiquinone oxidoreductase subunit NqrB